MPFFPSKKTGKNRRLSNSTLVRATNFREDFRDPLRFRREITVADIKQATTRPASVPSLKERPRRPSRKREVILNSLESARIEISPKLFSREIPGSARAIRELTYVNRYETSRLAAERRVKPLKFPQLCVRR